MEMEKTRIKESGDGDSSDNEYETYTELETLNSMVPLWKRNKAELKDEDYNSFYREKFFDFSDPYSPFIPMQRAWSLITPFSSYPQKRHITTIPRLSTGSSALL